MKRGSIQEVIPVILKPSLSEGGGEVCQVIWGRESVLNYSRALRLSYNIIKNYYKNKEGNLMMRGIRGIMRAEGMTSLFSSGYA